MLSAFMLWMQSSELKTHQENSVELNFKFQTSLVSNDGDCMKRRNVKSGDVGVKHVRFSSV